MNKINCGLHIGVTLHDLPVGAIFVSDGEFFIKIDVDAIFSNLDLACICDEGDSCGCPAMIDRDSIPSAIRISDGLAMYFEPQQKVDVVLDDATITIK